MPAHIVSNDVKLYIPIRHSEGHTIKHICSLLGVGKTLVYKTLNLYERFGIIYNPHKYSHVVRRHRILSIADTAFIHTTIIHWNTIYLNDLQHKLWDKHCVYATLPTLQ
jgi:hypothetical protein